MPINSAKCPICCVNCPIHPAKCPILHAICPIPCPNCPIRQNRQGHACLFPARHGTVVELASCRAHGGFYRKRAAASTIQALELCLDADTFGEVSDTLRQLSDTSVEVSDTLRQLSDTSVEVSDTLRQLSDTSVEVSDTLRQLSDTSVELSDTSRQVSDTLRQMSDTPTKHTIKHAHRRRCACFTIRSFHPLFPRRLRRPAPWPGRLSESRCSRCSG